MSSRNQGFSDAFDLILFFFTDLSVFSPREIILVAFYLTPGPTFCNGTAAARAAGYRGEKSPTSQASDTIKKAKQCGLFAALRAAAGIDPGSILRSVGNGLHAKKKHVSVKKNGEIVVTDVGEDFVTQHKTIELLQKLDMLPPLLGQKSADADNGSATGNDGLEAHEPASTGSAAAAAVQIAMPDEKVKAVVESFCAAGYGQTIELSMLLAEKTALEAKIEAAEATSDQGENGGDQKGDGHQEDGHGGA